MKQKCDMKVKKYKSQNWHLNFFASQKVTKIRRNIFPVVHAIGRFNSIVDFILKEGLGGLLPAKEMLFVWLRQRS